MYKVNEAIYTVQYRYCRAEEFTKETLRKYRYAKLTSEMNNELDANRGCGIS